MDLVLDKNKLRFLVIPTRFPSERHTTDYLKAYACWKEVWNNALKQEMNILGDLYSDNFTKQSHVAIIFYENEVACLTTLNYLDLKSPVVLDDSYFKVWPEITRQKIKKEANKVMVSGNLSLNFNFRRGVMGISWKDLMFAFQVRHLKSSSYDAVVAAVRLEKGMERAAYRTGAHALSRDLPYTIEGQRVDIVCWPRNLDVLNIDNQIYALVEHVWKNSWEIVDNDEIKKGVKDVA
ncbi:MAG: hypothetical protein H0V66_04635 [Bdellovibrionales bacterium]|nr:hypothetical protein [Bdellovibrionales bacterium]